jgi:hypothetical protein
VKPEVQETFLDAFELPLEVDGTWRSFIFSDGNTLEGRITRRIHCLDVTEGWTDPTGKDTHYIFHEIALVLMFRASDVPDEATLYSNAFVDVDGTQYRIDSSKLEYGLYTLVLKLLGTN